MDIERHRRRLQPGKATTTSARPAPERHQIATVPRETESEHDGVSDSFGSRSPFGRSLNAGGMDRRTAVHVRLAIRDVFGQELIHFGKGR